MTDAERLKLQRLIIGAYRERVVELIGLLEKATATSSDENRARTDRYLNKVRQHIRMEAALWEGNEHE